MERTDLKWSTLLPLLPTELNELKEGLAGVFRISEKKKDADGKYYVIFVGSSSNIKKELLKIVSPKFEDLSLMSYLRNGSEFAFRYVEGIDDEALRKAIEKQMYKHYAPQFNKQEPSSSLDVRVNLS